MAAADDDITTIENKLWTLLLARTGEDQFVELVKKGNRVRMTTPSKQRVVDSKLAKQIADFPEVKIDRGENRETPFRNMVTFGNCARVTEGSQEFTITITTDDEGSIKAGQVLAELKAAIIADGEKLGLTNIVNLIEEFRSTSQVTDQGTAAGVKRRVITATIRISLRKNIPAEP